MNNQPCTLHWNTHNSFLLQNLQDLRIKGTYSDATIACDGEFFAVHKLVLSAASDYFKEIFSRIESTSPMIIIKDISPKDIKYLLDFIYLGKVDVKTYEMASFATAAESLKIKGFPYQPPSRIVTSVPELQMGSPTKSIRTIHLVSPSKCLKSIPKPIIDPNSSLLHIGTTKPIGNSQGQRNIMVRKVTCDSSINKQKPWLEPNLSSDISTMTTQEDISSIQISDLQWIDGVKIEPPKINHHEQMDTTELLDTSKLKKQISCNKCDKTFKKQKYLNLHMKTHLGEKRHQCNVCGFRSVQSGVLTRHMRKHTGEKPFGCQFCDYKSTQKGALQRHIKLKHSISLQNT